MEITELGRFTVQAFEAFFKVMKQTQQQGAGEGTRTFFS
jgi:hypothetical protein